MYVQYQTVQTETLRPPLGYLQNSGLQYLRFQYLQHTKLFVGHTAMLCGSVEVTVAFLAGMLTMNWTPQQLRYLGGHLIQLPAYILANSQIDNTRKSQGLRSFH